MRPVHDFSRSQGHIRDIVKPVLFQTTSAGAYVQGKELVHSSVDLHEQKFTFSAPVHDKRVNEDLFAALADAKIWTSKVYMHMDRATRDRLFRQLDILHDIEEWSEGDKPVSVLSYKSLVRAILFHKINCRPSLSLMPSGNLLAMWQDGNDKLTVEFVADDKTRWFVRSEVDGKQERATGIAGLERLRAVLAPYNASRWFDGN